MTDRNLDLDADPQAALEALRSASADTPVLVFKKSPICPVSHRAEFELKSWRKSLTDEDPVRIAMVDVIEERPLARGLTAELNVKHESPQALWFAEGALAWHGSHGELTQQRFASLARGEI